MGLAILTPRTFFENITLITPDWMSERGFEGIITDLDDTLAPASQPLPGDELTRWARQMRDAGVGVIVLSNNMDARVRKFCGALGVPYIAGAAKPLRGGYIKACELLGKPAGKVVFVGDQIFTDIWGANNAGIYTVGVRHMGSMNGPFITFKRLLERPLWAMFFRRLHKDGHKQTDHMKEVT